MRGEVCVGFGSFFAFVSLLLMIFVNVSQINTSKVPRGLSMAKVNTSGYGVALENATSDPIAGLYTFNASAPLGTKAGLRQLYSFGLYGFCAYVNETAGSCSNQTAASTFTPYDIITSDMADNYTSLTSAIIQDMTFRDQKYLTNDSRAAYYLLLLGTICAALALFTGVARFTLTFFFSTGVALLGSVLLLAGAAIWTVMIKKSEAVNDILLQNTESPIPLGIIVSAGSALYMTWAAFACLLISVIPYMISCCTYRG